MMTKYYFKATLDGGRSGYDPAYIHHEGINVHPNPDTSDRVCSHGVHLATTIEGARSYVSYATEVYLACPIGKIYARGDDKIRVGKYRLWLIPQDLLRAYEEARAPAETVLIEATLRRSKEKEKGDSKQ